MQFFTGRYKSAAENVIFFILEKSDTALMQVSMRFLANIIESLFSLVKEIPNLVTYFRLFCEPHILYSIGTAGFSLYLPLDILFVFHNVPGTLLFDILFNFFDFLGICIFHITVKHIFPHISDICFSFKLLYRFFFNMISPFHRRFVLDFHDILLLEDSNLCAALFTTTSF